MAVALILGGSAAAGQPASTLASATDFYGARIGMTREEVVAHALRPGIAGKPCTTEPSHDPKQLFVTCGPVQISADFTAAGKVWRLRASYDMSGTVTTLVEARAALVARYGEPTGSDGTATLAWLAPGTPARMVLPCLGEGTVLVAQIELRGDASAQPLPTIDPGCAPLRFAILAERGGHHGVIVETQDPRLRLAELSRAR